MLKDAFEQGCEEKRRLEDEYKELFEKYQDIREKYEQVYIFLIFNFKNLTSIS